VTSAPEPAAGAVAESGEPTEPRDVVESGGVAAPGGSEYVAATADGEILAIGAAGEMAGRPTADAQVTEPVTSRDSPAAKPATEDAGADRQPPAGEREFRRPRHVKPSQTELDDGDFSLLIVGAGASRGVEPADMIELITAKGGLPGSDVRRVRVLSRLTLAQIPSVRAGEVAAAIDGTEIRGREVAAEAVVATAE
ncbi:MAG: DbpA RNA binding domain-containing protein, partial [Solirubrobacterales bacterium]